MSEGDKKHLNLPPAQLGYGESRNKRPQTGDGKSEIVDLLAKYSQSGDQQPSSASTSTAQSASFTPGNAILMEIDDENTVGATSLPKQDRTGTSQHTDASFGQHAVAQAEGSQREDDQSKSQIDSVSDQKTSEKYSGKAQVHETTSQKLEDLLKQKAKIEQEILKEKYHGLSTEAELRQQKERNHDQQKEDKSQQQQKTIQTQKSEEDDESVQHDFMLKRLEILKKESEEQKSQEELKLMLKKEAGKEHIQEISEAEFRKKQAEEEEKLQQQQFFLQQQAEDLRKKHEHFMMMKREANLEQHGLLQNVGQDTFMQQQQQELLQQKLILDQQAQEQERVRLHFEQQFQALQQQQSLREQELLQKQAFLEQQEVQLQAAHNQQQLMQAQLEAQLQESKLTVVDPSLVKVVMRQGLESREFIVHEDYGHEVLNICQKGDLSSHSKSSGSSAHHYAATSQQVASAPIQQHQLGAAFLPHGDVPFAGIIDTNPDTASNISAPRSVHSAGSAGTHTSCHSTGSTSESFRTLKEQYLSEQKKHVLASLESLERDIQIRRAEILQDEKQTSSTQSLNKQSEEHEKAKDMLSLKRSHSSVLTNSESGLLNKRHKNGLQRQPSVRLKHFFSVIFRVIRIKAHRL